MNIAYFISSHGFGHAARSSAVINQLLNVGHKITIYSTTPEWFFNNSLPEGGYEYTHWLTDVGLVQKNPFEEDIPKTIQSIHQIFPPKADNFHRLVEKLNQQKTELIISDISPLGILAAEAIHCDSILIENFTWDWIYEAYLHQNPGLQYWIKYFADVFNRASHHFVTKPFCQYQSPYPALEPISRETRNSRELTREKLGIQPNEKMVLVTMGGIPIDFQDSMFGNLSSEFKVVFPVGNLTEEKIFKNYHLLPHNHQYFHPDLVQASELVIAKVGYSTIAEAFHGDKPLLYIPRSSFPESEKLEHFIQKAMRGKALTETELFSGFWQKKALQLLEEKAPLYFCQKLNGADQILAFIENNYV